MGTWEWDVGGRKVRGQGDTEEQAWENANRQQQAAPAPTPTSGAPDRPAQTGQYTGWGPLTGSATGLAQGLTGSLADIRGAIGDPLRFFETEDARKLKEAGVQRAKDWAGQPSQTRAQDIGKAVGGSLPYMVGGPSALASLATRAVPQILGHAFMHGMGHALGISPRLVNLAIHALRGTPIARAGVGAAGVAGGAVPALYGGARAQLRRPGAPQPPAPQQPSPPPTPRPEAPPATAAQDENIRRPGKGDRLDVQE
jgi:hypothetical protein